MPTSPLDTAALAALDHAHVWHPFTPMRQWREQPPLVIARGEGPYLFDTDGRRYIDGVSSLWCNVHGHRVPALDAALRAQLDLVAHSTLLGLSSPPAIELAARVAAVARRELGEDAAEPRRFLRHVFYSDAGATAVEVAFKMAVGYWHHRGRPGKCRFLGMAGAYHGDTTGAMSVGFSDLFHRPFSAMVFPVSWFPAPDNLRSPVRDSPPGVRSPRRDAVGFPSADPVLTAAVADHCIAELARLLDAQADETAAVVLEPVVQGAAGMIVQPPGFVRRVADLARAHDVLLIADEVATGFGRTGSLLACGHDRVTPDLLCLAKGITGGYLPLAATLATPEVFEAFTGEPADRRTFFHGHTYTGNPLACAVALASLDLFDQPTHGSPDLVTHARASARIIAQRLAGLADHPHVLDVRQRGLMVGVELGADRTTATPFDFTRRTAAALCLAMRAKGLILRPLGDVLVLMPPPAMPHAVLHELLDIVVGTLRDWRW